MKYKLGDNFCQMAEVDISKTKTTATTVVPVKTDTLPAEPALPPPPAEILLSKPAGLLWDRILRGLIYAVTFLLPVLFTPWTFEPLEFSKQLLLLTFTALAIVVWLLRLLATREGSLIKTVLDLPILVFLLVYLLAAILSVDQVASFLGFYGSFSGNFFQILFLAFFYYLVVNVFQSEAVIRRLIAVFFFSAMVTVVFAVLQFFGLHIIPFAVAKNPAFNTLGSLLSLSLFAVLTALLSSCLKSSSWFGFEFGRAWRIIAGACSFLILFTVNFLQAWVALLVGLLLYVVFRLAFAKDFTLKELMPQMATLVLVISFVALQLVFPFFSVRAVFRFDLPQEVRLDYQTAQPVLVGAVSDRPILGSGPNTFAHAFSKYRDPNFNLTPFWNARFDRAPSEAAEYLVGVGVLGFLAFEILAGIFLIYNVMFLYRRPETASWPLTLTIFAAFSSLWFAHWFFFFTAATALSFWLLMALLLSLMRGAQGEIKTWNISLKVSPRQTVGVVSGVSFLLIVMIVFLFFAGSVYAADIFYRRGISESARKETFDLAQRDFERAVRLNRFRPDYYLTYGEFLFARINEELAKTEPNLSLIQTWLAMSINTSRLAVDRSPNNWTAWERLANLYTFARPLVAGVDKFIIESLTKATENDSKNPILFTELGQIYRLASRQVDPAILGKGADSDADGLTDEQERALSSNPENPDSNGNNVLDGSEVLAGLNPASSGQLPQDILAKYLRTDADKLLKAEQAFRKALELKPDYGTAYYHLALTLEEGRKFAEAAEVLRQALERFPSDMNLKFELGRMYYNAEKLDLAQRQFQEILLVSPNHANARYSLGLIFERQGKIQQALQEYRRILQFNPDNAGLKNKIFQLEQVK